MSSDYPIFKLSDFILDPKYLDDVVSTLLNTIFFHRALGPVQINYVRCEKLPKITQLLCGEPGVDKDILKLVNQLKSQINFKVLRISLKFMEEQQAKFLGMMRQKPKTFEQWIITLKNGTQSEEKCSEDLTALIQEISDIATTNYDHFDEQFDQSQLKPLKYPYELILL